MLGKLKMADKHKYSAQETIQAKLLFFPEGTRGTGDKLLPFKKGCFHVAVESQAFIQPVVISKYHFLKSKAKIFKRGQNIIKILPEVSCAGLSKDNIPALMERVQKMMQREYEQLSEESLSINNISEVHYTQRLAMGLLRLCKRAIQNN